MRGARAWFWGFTAVGLLMFGSAYFDDLARMQHGRVWTRFIEEMTGAYTAFVLLPFVRFAALATGWDRRFSWRPAAAVVLAALAYTAMHTSLMWLSRRLVFPLLGLGPYDYGLMTYRYPMEAAKDVLVFTILVAATLFAARVARGRAAELAAAGLAAELAEARIENLQLQLQPHFLFNTLNAISAVMYEDVAKADAMLAKLSDFLRTVLEASGVPRVALSEELRVERLYVDIMRARLERALDLRISVADDARSAEIPFMLLQPLLENCIRHGLARGRTQLDIAVDVRRARGDVVIDVCDNGSGFVPGGVRGLGLRNVEARLAQTFGDAATFSIGARAGGGTRATVTYPAEAPVA